MFTAPCMRLQKPMTVQFTSMVVRGQFKFASTTLCPIRIHDSLGNMIHEIFPVGPLQCNCSVIGDEQTREAMVIDPGDEIEDVMAVVQRHGLTVKQIVITHAHIDHIGGASKLKRLTGAPVLLNQNDNALLKMLDVQAAWIGMGPPEKVAIDGSLGAEDKVCAGRPIFCAGAEADCRRHTVCRFDRPHRSPRRFLQENHAIVARPCIGVAGRNGRRTRARTPYHDRAGARDKPVSGGVRVAVFCSS